MPAKSKAQFHLMAAVEHNPAFAKKVGIKPSVGAKFVDATPNYKSLPKRVKKLSKHPVSKKAYKL